MYLCVDEEEYRLTETSRSLASGGQRWGLIINDHQRCLLLHLHSRGRWGPLSGDRVTIKHFHPLAAPLLDH